MELKNNSNDIISPALLEKVQDIINKDDKYCKLKRRYDDLNRQHNFVQAVMVKAKMDEVMRNVVNRVVEQEIKERETTEGLLRMLPDDEREKYRDLLNALCFCYDAIDYIMTDVNQLLRKNNISFVVDKHPEIKACKEKVSSLISFEMGKMDEDQKNLYDDEADKIYTHLVKRGGVFRRKLDKLPTRG